MAQFGSLAKMLAPLMQGGGGGGGGGGGQSQEQKPQQMAGPQMDTSGIGTLMQERQKKRYGL